MLQNGDPYYAHLRTQTLCPVSERLVGNAISQVVTATTVQHVATAPEAILAAATAFLNVVSPCR